MKRKSMNQFDKLANMWWDPHGPMETLHTINPVRTKWIVEQIPKSNAKILDVGCGAGIATEALAMLGYNMTGLDISKKLISVAKKHTTLNNLNINYISNDIDAFSPQHASSFDHIICLEMLEHVDEPEKFLQAMAYCLKPNGKLFISTINRNIKSWALAIQAAENVLKIIPKGTHQYDKFIKPSEMKKIAESYNFRLLKTTGLEYSPFTKKARLVRSMDINYFMSFQKQPD